MGYALIKQTKTSVLVELTFYWKRQAVKKISDT